MEPRSRRHNQKGGDTSLQPEHATNLAQLDGETELLRLRRGLERVAPPVAEIGRASCRERV